MPDFMAGLARGIEQSKSLVAKAMDGVAANMVINPQIGKMETATAAVSAGAADTLSGITAAIREGLSQVGAILLSLCISAARYWMRSLSMPSRGQILEVEVGNDGIYAIFEFQWYCPPTSGFL